MVRAMEQATISTPARAEPGRVSRRGRGCRRRAGDPLRARPARLPDPASSAATATSSPSRFPFFGRIVYVADPAWSKPSSPARPTQFHAGEANATVLEPALGPNSVLTLDDAPHMQQRKLLLPPFHGERIQRYGELMREVTLREMESWPVGEPFALRPHTQRITLAVIMRAVFGVHDEERLDSLRAADRDLRQPGQRLITAFPMLRRNLGRWSPWPRFLRAREALDEFIYEEIALRRAEIAAGERSTTTCSRCCCGARHDDGSPMSDEELRDELVTVLGAGHETTATGLAWAVERLLRTPRVLRGCATRSPPARTSTATLVYFTWFESCIAHKKEVNNPGTTPSMSIQH